MSFQFNFFAEAEKIDKSCIKEDASDENSNAIKCEEFILTEELYSKMESDFEYEVVEGFPEMIKRKYTDALINLRGKDLSEITETSDVVTRKYEGGLKTWECSIDLLNHLKKYPLAGCKNVLEIGCGSGLPGIYCAKEMINSSADDEDCLNFTFQDFNCSVLESVTVPNAILNIVGFPKHREKFKFFYGDWNDFPRHLNAKSFDLILTSETIYRAESYPILMKTFQHALSEDGGRVLLAAKDYYFGLGGSVQEFIKYVKHLGGWRIKIVETFSEGVPRSILELCKHRV